MNSHLFTFTNHRTERNTNFFDLYEKIDRTCINLMGKNKLNSKIISIFMYPLFFILLLPFSIFTLIKNRNVENYVVLTSFHLTLVEDRKIIKPNSLIEKFIIYLDRIFFTIPDKLIFETSEMEQYVKHFLGMQKEKSLVLTSYRDLPEGLDSENLIHKEENIYEVAFWGSFERMHGLDTILDSAIELNRGIRETTILQRDLIKDQFSLKYQNKTGLILYNHNYNF